ncbi:4'-phosphopantetheinyl transferase superfamily protein [Cryptosporangium aurantiacum]|uniref:4'-phosphopantetheinyl transferase superfamily protein n=1 Tax=Cryptosporangium aurantiacum TaxID=134849 RepID=A0A1M7QA44_9ACTN|nr:4'-phosphopantetheinyl transferase superfamily protein [Cryptosporangium aurantiacum]SHN27609.1 4'-phosphopantetheinyl transferase superfamily protein [Cryptosporangium aurantiacum]
MSVGIDVVEVDRVARLVARYGGRLRRTIGSPAEASWAASTVRVAALFAVKEATVKAVGGRPPGFRWSGVSVTPSDAVSPVLDALVDGVGLTSFSGVRVDWPGAFSGVGRWGAADGHVYAAVVMGP